jgi:hypothetical protein
MAIYRGTGTSSTGLTIPELVVQAETASTNASVSATSAAGSAASALAIFANTTAMNAAVATTTTNSTNAGNSQTAAGNSATAAALSATNAAGSALTASNAAGSAGLSATAASNSQTAAGNSATTAGNSATAAVGSALTASNASTASGNSAVAAALSETNAAASTASALAIYGSIGAVNTAVTSASNSATAASTSATNSANSAIAATTSATTATNQAALALTYADSALTRSNLASSYASAAAGSVITAESAATASATSAANSAALYSGLSTVNAAVSTANTSANSAAASASAASASATTATNASNLAVTAWSASTAPNETLATVNKTFFTSAAIVDSIIYDTRKDSDGGAWRKRCTGTSWYNETVYGKWLGEVANEAAARAIVGATTNDYFHNTTDGLFYALNVTSGVTQVYRGNKREFPECVGIVTEATREIYFDLTDATMPMWKVVPRVGKSLGYVAASNGKVIVGSSSGVFVEDFIKSLVGQVESYTTTTVPAIINNAVSSLAATVLPNAPIDPATGIAVPTIAVGTAGGVSEIQNDGTVTNSALTTAAYGVSYDALNRIVWNTTTDINCSPVAPRAAAFTASTTSDIKLGSGAYSTSNLPVMPAITTATGKTVKNAVASSSGLLLTKIGQSIQAMFAAVTNTYNSGWQVGDSRGAWLADTVAGTVSNPATESDRSVKANPLTVFGTLTKSPVAAGSQLVSYSGFSATNYLEQPYSANLDFGTGDFCIMGWVKRAATGTELIYDRTQANGVTLYISNTTGFFSALINGVTSVSTLALPANIWAHFAIKRTGTSVYSYVNGVVAGLATGTAIGNTVNGTSCVAQVGGSTTYSLYSAGAISLLRASATAPSADQIAYIYETERKMFEPNAQVTLAGTSAAVTALAYDEVTDLLHAGTSYGRSTFKGLVRTESEATTNGAPKAYASYDGNLIQAGATGSKVYIPSKAIRDELNRAAEQKKAFGQELISQDFTATASQTAFVLPIGFVPKFTYQQGLLKKQTTGAGYWTSSYDGFRYTVTLGTGATLNDIVSILCTRSN